jgi:Rrf2 family protein
MALRNHVEWALYCCVVLAALPPGQYVSTKALSDFYRLPKDYLHKALQRLSNAGLVETSPGPTGGYRLAKTSGTITALEIVEAVDAGSEIYRPTNIHAHLPFSRQGQGYDQSAIDRAMYDAEGQWRRSLQSVTLQELAQSFERDFESDGWKRNVSSMVGEH